MGIVGSADAEGCRRSAPGRPDRTRRAGIRERTIPGVPASSRQGRLRHHGLVQDALRAVLLAQKIQSLDRARRRRQQISYKVTNGLSGANTTRSYRDQRHSRRPPRRQPGTSFLVFSTNNDFLLLPLVHVVPVLRQIKFFKKTTVYTHTLRPRCISLSVS